MKSIGITCDFWKVEIFRRRLIEQGFELSVDAVLSKESKVHFFKIAVTEDKYDETFSKLGRVLKQLEIECKQSN